jgi:hypothetical protein
MVFPLLRFFLKRNRPSWIEEQQGKALQLARPSSLSIGAMMPVIVPSLPIGRRIGGGASFVILLCDGFKRKATEFLS